MKNLQKMMKQAQKMQEQLESEMGQLQVEATSGGGDGQRDHGREEADSRHHHRTGISRPG